MARDFGYRERHEFHRALGARSRDLGKLVEECLRLFVGQSPRRELVEGHVIVTGAPALRCPSNVVELIFLPTPSGWWRAAAHGSQKLLLLLRRRLNIIVRRMC